MFEFIRSHQRLMQILLMIIIVPSFLLVGISGYESFGDSVNTIVKVGNLPITQQDWEQQQRQQLDRYRQMMGAQFDQKMFDTPEAKQAILENLIAQRAVAVEVAARHLSVSDSALQKQIQSIPGLVLADGRFDMEQYKMLLAQQGLTPATYDGILRRDLAVQQLSGAVEGSAFMPRSVASRLSDLNSEQRDVQELLLPSTDYAAQVKVTDAMVKAFYDNNSKFFDVPEQVKVEYVVLDSAALAAQVTVSDADINAYYAANQKRYTAEEARRASHILIAVKKGASDADKAAAKAKAESILAELRKNPADFAKIAKAQSQDPASAELGGDLDFITRGSLPKPVEDAAYALKQGQISDVVESDFGYHIITITDLKPAVVKPLADVKAEITAALTKQKSAKLYSDMAEQFTNAVYEQADSLKPAADKLKLTVQTAPPLSRTPNPQLGTAPFNNAKFLTALFSDSVLKSKRNTDAIEVAPNTLIAGRVVEYKAASKRPLADVDGAIRQRVTQDEAAKLAQSTGAAKLAALRKADDAAGFGAVKVVSRTVADGISPAAMAEVMKADVSKLPAFVGVTVPGSGYALYRISKVGQPATQDQARRTSELGQLNQIAGQEDTFNYVDFLKKKAKVKMIRPIGEIGSGQGQQ